MFNRLRNTIDVLMGRYASIEDQLRKERHESAWLHTCLRGLLLQAGGTGRVKEATQLRLISCDQIWISRGGAGGGDLILMLVPERVKEVPGHVVAAIAAR